VIHLDTHVVAWLAAGEVRRISELVLQRLEQDAVAISPMVELELAFLQEIGRLTQAPDPILAELRRSIGLKLDETSFRDVVEQARNSRLEFTRDPFDRMIAAQAAAAGVQLVSKDRKMRKHLEFVIWD